MPDHRPPATPMSMATLLSLALLVGCGPAGGDSGQAPDPPVSTAEGPGEAGPASAEGVGFHLELQLEARYPVGFSFLNGIREMPDGWVLAADPLSQVLLRISPDFTMADTLGRPGPGPQEYRQPDRIFPLPGDTSLLVDLGKAQLTTVLPDGSFGESIPMMLPSDEGFGQILHPQFVDHAGNLYFQAGRSREEGPPDSASIVRFRRGGGAIDTVGQVWLPENNLRRTRRHGFLPKLLEERDKWAIGPDGSLAIIRAHGSNADWILPGGGRVTGPEQAFQTHPVSGADKEALLAIYQSEAISSVASATRSGQVVRMTMSRGIPASGDGPGVEDFEWAETFPVFRSDRAMVSPAGELWAERWVPSGLETQWEVFAADGHWLGSVNVGAGRRLLGFGSTAAGEEAIYLAASDEFDLKWLERHRVVR